MEHLDPQDFGLKINDRPYRLLGWITLATTFVLLLGWSVLAPLDSAVVANGRINVASLNKSVQHLDGGLVRTIAVRDGELVRQGQLLLSLDPKPLEIKLDNIKDQLIETEANLERLSAERDNQSEFSFSADLEARVKQMNMQSILTTQHQLFESRRQALQSEQAVLRQRLVKTKQEIVSSQKLIRTLNHRLDLLSQDLSGVQKLADRNMASKMKLREVQRQKSELHGDVISREADVVQLEFSLPEIRSQIDLLEKDYRKEVITQLRDLQTRRINLQAEQQTVEEKLGRIDILAPVTGKIKGLEVVTLGAVINAGNTLMEIVPHERDFRIHAQLSPMDIDSIYPGLKAEVRIPVFDGSQHFPSLYTSLEDVSTDVYLEQRSGDAYYKATFKVDGESLTVLEKKNLRLISGMPVEVVIKTGERTLFDYLIKPLRDMVVRSFNEA